MDAQVLSLGQQGFPLLEQPEDEAELLLELRVPEALEEHLYEMWPEKETIPMDRAL